MENQKGENMKDKFYKRLTLNKEKVSKLTESDMSKIRGASIVHACTESCSLVHICCDTKTIPLEKNQGNV